MRRAPQQDNPTLGIALVLGAMLIFATQDAVTKHLAQSYSTAQILWVRFVFYAAFALLYSLRKKPLSQCLKSERPRLQIFRSLLILVEIGTFVVAIRVLSLAEIHSLMATFPLIVTAFSALFLKETVGIRRWAAVLVGFLGVLVILRPGVEALQPGALVALAAAAMFAGYTVLTRVVARHDDSETSLVYMAVIGAVATTAVGPFFWTPPTLADWGWLLLLSCTAATGHMLLIKALEAAPASTLQPFNYTLLVFATVIGYLVFDNLPDLWTVVGAGIVVASGLYTIYRERVRGARRPPPDIRT
ncbi:MAG: DMT family transporter [Alphaproteobacteria bacterium]|nr:DMT family transporter [Alphaproteobacteria bacterium]